MAYMYAYIYTYDGNTYLFYLRILILRTLTRSASLSICDTFDVRI